MKRLAKRMIITMVMLTMLMLTGTTVYAAKKVTIKASNVSMTSTQKKQLKVTTSPSKAKLTYTSSDSSIVAVSSKGLLTGKKAGTAKVTIKAAKKGSYQANTRTITVTVKKTVNSVTALDLKVKVGTTVSAQAKGKTPLSYTSGAPEIFTVDKNGKITGVSAGTGRLTIKARSTDVYYGKTKTINVTVTEKKEWITYKKSGDYLTVSGPKGTRTYHIYKGSTFGKYYLKHGCVTGAISIAASALGNDKSPSAIHKGAADKTYSERYAIKKMGLDTALNKQLFDDCSITLRTAGQILTDMKITNKVVYDFDKSKAIKEIKAHLAEGKPVIVKAHNRLVDGIQVAGGHHAMVLVGIDNKGFGIFICPTSGEINLAKGNGKTFRMTVDDFVNKHMDPATDEKVYMKAYVTSNKQTGGYILVG